MFMGRAGVPRISCLCLSLSISRVIHCAQTSLLSCHPVVRRGHVRQKAHFWCSSIEKEVGEYVTACPVCNCNKVSQHHLPDSCTLSLIVSGGIYYWTLSQLFYLVKVLRLCWGFGRLSPRFWEPLSDSLLVITLSPMGKWSVSTRRWKLSYVASSFRPQPLVIRM